MIYDLQKASLWKRFSALLLDIILLCIIATGFAYLISGIVGYDSANEKVKGYYTNYEEAYGVKFDISQEDYAALTEEEAARYGKAYEALLADGEAMYAYSMVVSLTLVITSLGILFAYLAMELAVPLLFKNGQTVGKKIFGIGVMRVDGVRLNAITLTVRTLLGKYTLETMIPVLIFIMIYFNNIGLIGTVILGLIALLQVILLFSTGNHAVIHDLLARTTVVDMASQMIFDSEADMLAYKKKISAERAAREPY